MRLLSGATSIIDISRLLPRLETRLGERQRGLRADRGSRAGGGDMEAAILLLVFGGRLLRMRGDNIGEPEPSLGGSIVGKDTSSARTTSMGLKARGLARDNRGLSILLLG